MLTVITSSYSCTKTLERMSYRPMEMLSFHSSLSTEFWKLHKSASVPKVGHHRRREGQRLGALQRPWVLCWGRYRPGLRAHPTISINSHSTNHRALGSLQTWAAELQKSTAIPASSFLYCMPTYIPCSKHRLHHCFSGQLHENHLSYQEVTHCTEKALLRNKGCFAGGIFFFLENTVWTLLNVTSVCLRSKQFSRQISQGKMLS